MRTLKALSANPWMAKFGTAWMAVAFVLVSVCGAVAALWRSKLASAFLGLSSHRLLSGRSTGALGGAGSRVRVLEEANASR
jgi:hypothetical protein